MPDKCPICNYACEPIPVLSYNRGKNFNDNSEVVFLVCACPRNDCKELFLVRYKKIYYDADMYSLVGYSPFKYKDIIFEECISDISQTFVDIYNQAMKAEKYNLIDIAGVGYRKALEFLIKDYSIKKNPDSKNEIENSFLGKCITTFIKNENIKLCAKRATWIGNDETHYLRK
ncbi:DUF4145 domain-containing protein [Vallitalea guaymasensis]|uniref:DUF4145 domain-containing protein n=1 Tax=Vallitalea guaymasensis TaxID=1185412 RepID=A0A8J8MAZ9_9FIRM|nr:DUF4145 domain-containing protein [Vallitalea guaymasensis]QUH29612.1 DUF4145 domain-containing protein [Vallitalea guaymasensis]